MADSDGEYVDEFSDDDLDGHRVTSGADASSYGTRSKSAPGTGTKGDGRKAKGNTRSKAAWEDVQRSWEHVVETEDGAITIEALIEAEKRRRVMRDTTPLQRGIIRHLMLVLDMSFAMAEKDLLPNRYILALNYAVDFVREYFEQNPISQLGIVGMRDGIAVRISDMSGNPAEHIERLRTWAEQQEPQGNPSLQNALEMCRGALFHTPSHGTREVLIIYGALLSSDPGDIHDTISNLITDRIRVSIVGLAAQVAICAELCARTNAPFSNNQPGPISTTANATNYYSVALHEQHFRELFLAATTPPPTPAPPPTTTTNTSAGTATNASLLMMGFPSRALAAKDGVSLCACHHRPSREGYACTRCAAKVCRLPADCPVCGLTLILSTHLARSYHHLFPLRVWVEVGWAEAAARVKAAGGPAGAGSCCFACLVRFPEVPQRFLTGSGAAASTGGAAGKGLKAGGKGEKGAAGGEAAGGGAGGVDGAAAAVVKGVSESGRYKCQVCGNHFCIDCDVFAHEIIHNCPGCQSDTRGPAERNGEANGQPDNGTGEAMAVDS